MKAYIKKIVKKSLSISDYLACLFSPNTINTERTIIIRTDAIGDYILFRNFLKPLQEHYGKITLVGNEAYQDIVDNFDQETIEIFIPINRKKFIRSPIYRFLLIRKLRQYSYKTLINPIYSRDYISEEITKNIIASQKIGSIGDISNLDQQTKLKYDMQYTTLAPADKNIKFEFYRNLEFINFILKKNINIEYFLPINDIQNNATFIPPTPYSVLFIGASANFRKWGINHFAEVGKFLTKLGENIVICGGKEDFANGQKLIQLINSPNKVYNLCGLTTLTGLALVVYNGNHIISNETSCVHIAIAIRHNKVFVVSNGNHFGRFIPYPKEIAQNYFAYYHPEIEKNLEEYKIKSSILQKSDLDINQIDPQRIIHAIQAMKL